MATYLVAELLSRGIGQAKLMTLPFSHVVHVYLVYRCPCCPGIVGDLVAVTITAEGVSTVGFLHLDTSAAHGNLADSLPRMGEHIKRCAVNYGVELSGFDGEQAGRIGGDVEECLSA